MKVAVDARTLQDERPGGVGRGLANLLPFLADDAELVLLVDDRRPPIELDLPQARLRAPMSRRGAAWLQVALPRWLRHWPGIFHCPYNGLPFIQPVPMVVTIHDLTFESHPEFFASAWPNRRAFQIQARLAAKTAACVLTVAPSVRDEIIARYGLSENRILVAPNAVDPRIANMSEEAARRRQRSLQLPHRYVVALGGAERRGLQAAIDAWWPLREEIDLVAVGGSPDQVTRASKVLPWLDTNDWAALLRGAEAFVYPTQYESFGMPALEAAAVGVPTICAPVGALPETLGEAAAWADDPSAPAIRRVLSHLVSSPSFRAELGHRAREHAARWPSWQDTASTVLESWHMAARRTTDASPSP